MSNGPDIGSPSFYGAQPGEYGTIGPHGYGSHIGEYGVDVSHGIVGISQSLSYGLNQGPCHTPPPLPLRRATSRQVSGWRRVVRLVIALVVAILSAVIVILALSPVAGHPVH